MKHLKLFFALFAMLALGVGNAWAEEVTFNFQTIAQTSSTTGGIEWKTGKTGSATATACNSTNGLVLYGVSSGGGYFQTTSPTSGAITNVSITSSAKKNTPKYTIYGSTDGSTWTSIESDITAGTKNHAITGAYTYFKIANTTAATAQLAITMLTITYETAGGETPGEGEEPTPDPEEPGEDGDKDGETYELVTSISDLEAGAKYIVGNSASTSSIFMSTATNTNNRKVTSAITITDNKVTITEDVLILELGGETGAWTFKTTNYIGTQGFLTSAASGSNNHCKVVDTAESCSYFTLAFNDQEATITSTGRNERNILRYNSSSSLFACYSSGQSPVYLYKLITSSGGDEGGGETPEPTCTPINPTLTYSSTSLLTNSTATATLEGNTGNGDVTYTTSDDKVATVAADGTVTAVGGGTATITATIAAAGEYCGGTATAKITVTPLISCSEVYGLDDNATFALKEFVVTYANGKYTYIKDDTGYGVIFTNSGAYGLEAGNVVASGKLFASKTTYRGLVEIIPTTPANELGATSNTAPDPEVMNAAPVEGDMNKYAKFEGVTFVSTAFSSNSIAGNFGGKSITFYNTFGASATFDTSKKYNVVGCVSIYNTLQVNFISAEEVAEPTLNVKITDADFGKVAINDSHERTLTLNGSLLTKPVSLAIEGEDAEHFKLASNSVTPTEGTITDAKIKITYKPTAEGTHTATLKITSDELAEQTITLTGQAVQQHTVNFYVNKEKQTELAKTVLSGDKLTEIPNATSCDPLEYPTFIGWSASEITGTTDVEPTDLLDLNTTITADCNYYAVFAKETTTSSSSESATMAYSGTTTNMSDGNNASTVGLDEALFTITSDKGGQGNHVGLNKAGDIRLYANKTDGNGNILTIAMAEGYTITQISLDIKQTATFVVKANGQSITGTDNVYDINHSSCSIQNTTTGATTQLQLNSITISYTTSTISKEYLTTCESATPTYTVTYNLDGGESTCETSVVVEQNGELTLCDAPTKKGHTFLKWKDQSDNEYEAGATITVSSNLTLTAQWQKESYKVTWTSLGEEVASANVEYNSQPTKPATVPTYTCYGEKEFVGWTTKEIDGVGTPTNLYTDEFPVVTEPITYYAVFATRISEGSNLSKAITLANGDIVYLATENGLGISGANDNGKDATVSTIQNEWLSFTVETSDNTLFQFKNGEKYITAGAKQFKLTTTASNFTFSNSYIVYEISSGSDKGDYVLLENTNSGTYYRFYKISNMGAAKYTTFYVYKDASFTDYITSCDAVTSSISIDNISLCVGDVHTITATIKPATAASAVSYTIKENATNAISLSGNTITALAEGTATITATIEDATDYAGTSIDFKVTVDAAPVTSKVVILAQHAGQWYAMKAEKFNETSLNAIPVTYVNGTLYNVADSEKDAIEWERTTRGNTATFKKGENYLIGTTTGSTDLKLGDIAFEWAVDGNLYLCDDNKRTFIFNKEGYFKNYSTKNASNGVAIDATYSSLPVVTAPVYATGDAYGRTVTAGDYGTICIPFGSNVGDYTGAEFYEISWMEMDGATPKGIWLDQVNDALTAGKPYIFKATATELAVIGNGTTAVSPVTGVAGLTGTFSLIQDLETSDLSNTLEGNYMISGNAFLQCGTGCWLNANRAYIDATIIANHTTKKEKIPGRRRVCLGETGENTATGLDNITAPEGQAIKVIENGQLIIIRGGEKFNVQGQRL